MTNSPSDTLKPSFSPRRKWGMGLQVFFVLFLVLSVVVMVNYLSRDYYGRFHVSTRTRTQLSTRTVKLLESLTNSVKVTIYYDKQEPFYSTVADLLYEYNLVNRRLQVRTVDYLRDAASALQLKNKYNFLNSAASKNLVIFDCDGKVKAVDGNALTKFTLEQVPNPREQEFRRKPTAFMGEAMFTAALLDVSNPKPLKACFLTGHGEHEIDSADKNVGYVKMASVLLQNYITVEKISLLGTNLVPMDCNLLIIAGPTTPIPEMELEKVAQYLKEGGRLLALFNFFSVSNPTGLEKILKNWGVEVGATVIKDPDNTISGQDVVVANFSRHPVVNPLLQSRLHLMMPRAVAAASRPGSAEAPKVDEIAFTGQKAFLTGKAGDEPRQFPLMVTVEKGALKNVITERGTTRMIVVGDSIFLANHQIDSAANRDFAGYAANWLLDRTQLLEGLGPRPIDEYKLVMTTTQLHRAQLILLGAMPGSALLLGALVWLRRRR